MGCGRWVIPGGGEVGRVSGGSGEGVSRVGRHPGECTAYHNGHFPRRQCECIESRGDAPEKKIILTSLYTK